MLKNYDAKAKKSIGNSPLVQNNGCWDTMSIVRSYPGNFLFSHVILSLWSFEASKRRDPHYLTDMKIKFELTSSLIICIACGGPSNEKCFDKTQVFVICPYTLHQQIQTHQISQTVYLNSENWHWEFILDKIRTWESELLKGSSWECWPTSSENLQDSTKRGDYRVAVIKTFTSAWP